MSADAEIRVAESGDLARLVDIYNHYVTETHATFHTEPFAVGARTHWFAQFKEAGPYQLLVADAGGSVAGYATSKRYKQRAAYDTSVETSIYLDPDATGQGIGYRLYAALLDRLLEEPSVHRAYGGVGLPNDASVALHEKLGFRLVGTYNEVGFKFGKYWDVSWFEKDVSV